MSSTHLFLVHCGYYDPEVMEGLYESHVNFFVVAESFEDARTKAKLNEEFKRKKMHIDGLQQIEAVDGFKIHAMLDHSLQGASRVISHRHRDLAPKKPDSAS